MHIAEFHAAMHAAGLTRGAGVPCSNFGAFIADAAADPYEYVPSSCEGEAVAIAAGMTAAGHGAFAVMQNSGLGNAINPITSLLIPYQIPVALFVSRRGSPGVPDEPQHEHMGAVTYDMLRTSGVPASPFDGQLFGQQLEAFRGGDSMHAWVFEKGALAGKPADAAPAPRPAVESRIVALREPPPAMATRQEFLSALVPALDRPGEPTAVVSTTGKLSRELYELDQGDSGSANRFYMVGSMGSCSAFALGVALTCPLRVVALDGDGSVLMRMGSLATVGWRRPTNFHHVVVDNHAHDSTGGQPTASLTTDLAAVAIACGYRRADTTNDPGHAAALLDEHLHSEGPTFLRVMARTGARPDLARPTRSPAEVFRSFREWLFDASASSSAAVWRGSAN